MEKILISIIELCRCLNKWCRWLYSFDESISSPILRVSCYETFGEHMHICVLSSPYLPCPQKRTWRWEKGWRPLSAKGRQVADIHNVPLGDPNERTLGCSEWPLLPHFLLLCSKCQGCGKSNHHQPLQQRWLTLVLGWPLALWAQDNPGVYLRSQCHYW